MMQKITRLAFILTLLFAIKYVEGNNVSITGLTYLSGSDQVRFNVSWDNSWRNTGTAGSTQNYDGVWVFVKFRSACAKDSIHPSASNYSHMWLSRSTSDHIVPAGASLEVGTSSLIGSYYGGIGAGVFLYRSSDGVGTTTFNNVTLKWDKTSQGAIGTDWDIQVFAVEMVNIPRGPFDLGDGTTSGAVSEISRGEYRGDGRNEPYLVNSEDSIPTYVSGSGLQYSIGASSTLVSTNAVSANTPKGYNAFWCMKYEITQKQYVDFLNTLSRNTQYYMVHNPNLPDQFTLGDTLLNDGSSGLDNDRLGFFLNDWAQQRSYRNGITIQHTVSGTNRIVSGTKPWQFACDLNGNGIYNEPDDGMNTACNFLNGALLYAYLDWAALRPMNEFEFEKITRGPSTAYPYVPQSDAFVWGTLGSSSNVTQIGSSYTSPGTSTEVATTPISAVGQVVGGDSGPRRVGVTNRLGSTRIQSGSSYFGVSNMADNVYETVLRMGLILDFGSRPCQINYYRTAYGDGDITTSCVRESVNCPCDFDRWPLGWICGIGGLTVRGGSYATNSLSLNEYGISTRKYAGECSVGNFYSNTWITSSFTPDQWCNGCYASTRDISYLNQSISNYGVSSYYIFLSQLGGRGVR
jgi:hypothetical protein